jgi:hypothetical protein
LPVCDAFRSSFGTFQGSFALRSGADLGAFFIILAGDFALTVSEAKFITQRVDLAP